MKEVLILLMNQYLCLLTALKIGLKLDTFIQGVIIMCGVIALGLFAYDDRNGWMALTAFCGLGIAQVLSAIILSIGLKDKKRGLHLLHIIFYWLGYMVILVPIGFVLNLVSAPDFVGLFCALFYIFGVPILLAMRYFRFTIGDMTKVNTLHRSFWDL